MTRRLALTLLILTAGCSANPVDHKPELMLLNEREEVALGQEEDEQLVQELGLLQEGGELAKLVEDIGQRLVAVSARPKLKHTFRILDDATVNAFALPGGFVYVTRGLLAHMPSEACLAGVMGHEVGHVSAKHGASQASSDAVAESILSFGGLLPDAVTNVMLSVFDASSGLIRLSHSRDDERQSDELGVAYSSKLGYDARETARFFALVAKLNQESDSVVPTWKSTHPDPEERVVTIRGLAKAAKQEGKTYVRGTKRYLRLLEGLAVGSDPRNGLLQKGELLHPRLGIWLRLQAGWVVQKRATFVGISMPGTERSIRVQVLPKVSDLNTFAKELLARPNVTPLGNVASLTIDGLPAVRVEGRVKTDKGEVGATVTLLKVGGRTLGILGLVPWADWKLAQEVFVRVADSLRQLTPAERDAARPAVITIVEADRGATFEELAKPYPIPPRAKLTLREVAIMNGVLPHTRIEKGRLLKLVRMQPKRN